MAEITELALQTASLSWQNDAPFSEDFGDIYFNPQAGIPESLAVFIEPTQLAKRLQQDTCLEFSIIETGFGAGVNFLLAAATFAQHGHAPTWLNYTAIEAYPLQHTDLVRIHNQLGWPDKSLLSHLLQHFPPAVRGVYRLCWPHQRICLTLWWMDLHEALPQLQVKADAWFLDGFAPSKNPSMWSDAIYPQLARCSNPQARFSTFTASSQVRQGLQQAGFVVNKVKGFEYKRHRLEGYWPATAISLSHNRHIHIQPHPIGSTHSRHVTIVGSGISGCVTARAFAEQGYFVQVIDAAPQIAHGASGNSQAALFTQLSIHNSPYNQFQHAAYAFARQVIRPASTPWSGLQWSGLINLPAQTRDFRKQAQLANTRLWPENWMRIVSAQEASELAGIPILQDGMFYPLSARIYPARLCQQLLAHPRIELLSSQQVVKLQWTAPGWRLHIQQATPTLNHPALDHPGRGQHTLETGLLILCTAEATATLLTDCRLPLRPMRGQVTEIAENSLSKALRCIVSGQTYVMPSHQGYHLLGATYDHHDLLDDVRDDDHLRNLAGIQSWSPELHKTFTDTPPPWHGRAARRCQTPDYLPLIGPVSAIDAADELPYEDLLIHCGQGSRGFTQAWLGAEILLGYVSNRGFPLSESARLAVHPNRFQQRFLRKNIQFKSKAPINPGLMLPFGPLTRPY
jgi:tRNA 5-methylaminomethyl-2-thiouridine biosynthesis bifunctional protein